MRTVKSIDLALGLVRRERERQQPVKTYTLGHDDRHSSLAWIGIIAHELGCAAGVALREPGHVTSAYVKIAAVAVAAIEVELRRAAGKAEEGPA